LSHSFKNKLAATAAVTIALFAYSRRAYAASFVYSGTYSSTLTINANEASVSTASGFSVNTATGNAITITGDGALGFTDNNASTITTTDAAGSGLSITAGADDGGTPASIAINTHSVISGGVAGVYAINHGTGAVNITTDGDVSGTRNDNVSGIYAINHGNGPLNITTNGSVTATTTDTWSFALGINAGNYGTGALAIIVNGDVIGSGISGYTAGIDAVNNGSKFSITSALGTHITGGYYGISAGNNNGGLKIAVYGDVTGNNPVHYGIGISLVNNVGTSSSYLTLTTGSSSTVTGVGAGIFAVNNGTGATTITVNGDVSSTHDNGIYTKNATTATDLTITTGSGSSITGGTNGIAAYNNGTGATTITANGAVTGTTKHGIYAKNAATTTDLTITTGANSSITSGIHGIFAINSGTGATTITANGDITATGAAIQAWSYGAGALTITSTGHAAGGTYGIYAYDRQASGLSVSTGPNSSVTGSYDGILADNNGSVAAVTITANGDITGTTANGIYVYNAGTGITITTGANSVITGGTHGIDISDQGTGALTITNSGTVTGPVGILVHGNGATVGSITNESTGTIDGTGGTAISLTGLTAALPITINGGQIIGNVIDDTPSNGFSPVTVAHDFTSDGNFNVSGFDVASGAEFTFGAGNMITSYNAVGDSGTMTVAAAGSSITGNLNVNTGGTLTAGANFGVTGALTNNGAVTIATGKTLTIGTMTAGTGTLDFGLTSSANHGQLTVTGGGANLTGQTIDINVAGINSLTNNEDILLIHGASPLVGGPGATLTAVTDNSALWDFKIVDGTGITTSNDLYAVASLATATLPPNIAAVVKTLQPLQGVTTNPQLAQVITNINNASTTQALNTVIQSIQPQVSGGTTVATQNFSTASLNLSDQRLDALVSENTQTNVVTGMSAGSGYVSYAPGLKGWGQLTNQTVAQDAQDGIAGYSVHGWGATMGIDSAYIIPYDIIGLAVSYGQAQVNAADATSTRTTIDSYQISLYNNYDFGRGYYLNSLGGYTFSTNNTLRQNVDLTPGLDARGTFDSNEFTATFEGGRTLKYDALTLTPLMMANGAHYQAKTYSETGAGGDDLTNVENRAINNIDLGIGGKVSWDIFDYNEFHLVPEVHTAYRHDLVGDSVDVTSAFAGGGGVFSSQGARPAENKFNLGGQLKFYNTDNLSLTANYDFDSKSGYTSRTEYLRAEYKF
jgi:uncharacterized protein with beta-barrel porin domain